MSDQRRPSKITLESWLERQRSRDPALHAALAKKLAALSPPGIQTESAAATEATAGAAGPAIALETIVREGRPALFVAGNSFVRADSLIDDLSEIVVERLEASRAQVDPVMPMIGRIDVTNHATGLDFLGTGWLIAEDVVVTNRHVAELLATRGVDRYQFVMGRFGEPITASLGFGHERGGPAEPSVALQEVLFIEPPGTGPDIAFIKVARQVDGTRPKFIPLSETDPVPGQDVVVIGYPARAPSDVIPDQDRMEQLYGRTYNVKRAAPGKIDDPSRGWTTHDCTTLGGNSGSAVIDMQTGRACALHFAGLYLVENYAVPASTLRQYLGRRPWPYRVETAAAASVPSAPPAPAPAPTSITIPLTITVSLGQPAAAAAQASSPEAAASELGQMLGAAGVLAVRPGVAVDDDAMRDEACLVVAAHPDRVAEVRARTPDRFGGYLVQVRPASIDDQLGRDFDTEAPRAIAYDDDARTGDDFRLDWVTEQMQLRLHVGPDRGFEELSAFLQPTKEELVSSIYQFYADHIRQAVDQAFGDKVTAKLVADPQTRDHGPTPEGQFDRASTFAAWTATGRFENVYVPEGNGGLVDNAYHIKVTVRDHDHVWLSSGNWTRTSQPLIPAGDRDDPAKVTRAGNREWHVIADSPGLAKRYRSHILQDLARCKALGGQPEAVGTEIMIDVPDTLIEAITLEAPAERVFEPEVLEGNLRARPLLTPDHQGATYCDAVAELINSAQHQLLFQNQYINVTRSSAGRFGALVDALARAAQRLPDCRIILRSNGTGFWDNVSELRRRGIDVARQARRLANTHTKGIVVDGRQVLVGSHNWSQSGVTLNRDASLIIDDPRAADYYARVFETDWKRATKLTEPRPQPTHEAPRLATGAAPPPGFKRVPLATLLEG
jgi:phosphatidylserine/phosphatidylglycerophosphate/cardiolipin synthase-like enzyme